MCACVYPCVFSIAKFGGQLASPSVLPHKRLFRSPTRNVIRCMWEKQFGGRGCVRSWCRRKSSDASQPVNLGRAASGGLFSRSRRAPLAISQSPYEFCATKNLAHIFCKKPGTECHTGCWFQVQLDTKSTIRLTLSVCTVASFCYYTYLTESDGFCLLFFICFGGCKSIKMPVAKTTLELTF